MKNKFILSTLLSSFLLLSSCNSQFLSSWKANGKIETIKNYINDVCDKNSKNYIPEEYRISAWDIDGTGILERNTTNNDLLPQDQILEYTYINYRFNEPSIKDAYEDYVDARAEYWKNESDPTVTALFRASEVNFYNQIIGGLTPNEALSYFDTAMKNGNYTTEKKLMDIAYKPMKEIYSYLKQNKFQIYFVSGSFRYALYALASNLFGDIDFQHCIGTDFDTEYSVVDGKSNVVFTTISDPNMHAEKVNKIVKEIGKCPVISFGNSTGDLEMLQYTITNPKYKSLGVVINHDDSDREYSYNTEKVSNMCSSINALEISMKEEFINIF